MEFLLPKVIIRFFERAWLKIVGIIALEDCLGPQTLNGLTIFTGKLNDLKKLRAN